MGTPPTPMLGVGGGLGGRGVPPGVEIVEIFATPFDDSFLTASAENSRACNNIIISIYVRSRYMQLAVDI